MTIRSLFRNRPKLELTNSYVPPQLVGEFEYRTRILAEEVDHLRKDRKTLHELIQGLTHVVGLIQDGKNTEQVDLLLADLAGVSLEDDFEDIPDGIKSRT